LSATLLYSTVGREGKGEGTEVDRGKKERIEETNRGGGKGMSCNWETCTGGLVGFFTGQGSSTCMSKKKRESVEKSAERL